MSSTNHFDRQGHPISLEDWARLWGDPSYRFVERTWIQDGVHEVLTVWEGFDPYQVHSDSKERLRLFRMAELRWSWEYRAATVVIGSVQTS